MVPSIWASDVPAYGSSAFHQLAIGDERRVIAEVLWYAACWRRLIESPYIAQILAEWSEWDQRRVLREASWAVSSAAKERADDGWSWLSYAELEERRRLTSILPCADCGSDVELVHPFLDENWNAPLVTCNACALEGRAA